jgi:predicted alpha/beta hydrolase family esterase
MLADRASAASEPLVLLVPGLHDSGPDHWQTLWQDQLPRAERVELGMWDDPHRNTWVNQLNLAIHNVTKHWAGRPVILVAHSLACHVVSWWAEYERPDADGPVKAALLVAPPEVEQGDVDARLARFAPVMPRALPFPSILAASRDDPWIAFGRARRLARIWRSRFVDAGWLGHINAASGLRDWPFGQFLLRQLEAAIVPLNQPLVAARNYATLLEQGTRSASHAW